MIKIICIFSLLTIIENFLYVYLRQQNHNKILLAYLLVDQGMPEIAKIESVECVFRNVYNFVKRFLLLSLEGTRDGMPWHNVVQLRSLRNNSTFRYLTGYSPTSGTSYCSSKTFFGTRAFIQASLEYQRALGSHGGTWGCYWGV